MNSRRFWLLGLGVLIIIATSVWWAMRPNDRDDSVSIRFVGTTNHHDQTFVLFAVTNRLATNIRGSVFQINVTREGWFQVVEPLQYPPSPRRSEVWLTLSGTANSGAVLGTILSSSNTWHMVFGIDQGGVKKKSKIPWRTRLAVSLSEKGHRRLAMWIIPRPNKGWTPEMFPGEAVIGPKMHGAKSG